LIAVTISGGKIAEMIPAHRPVISTIIESSQEQGAIHRTLSIPRDNGLIGGSLDPELGLYYRKPFLDSHSYPSIQKIAQI
jgi:hypothetical protein